MITDRHGIAEYRESQYDHEHPYPRFVGVITYRYAMVYLSTHRWDKGQPVWYKRNKYKLSRASLYKVCDAKIRALREQYGEGSLWHDGHPVYYLDIFKPELHAKMLALKERSFEIMYYCELDGAQEGFKTMKLRDMMLKIRDASRKKVRVRIRYFKQSTKKTVVRDCAAYSYANGLLYVTDTRSGNTKIRSYKVEGIRSVVVTKKKFHDEYLLEL